MCGCALKASLATFPARSIIRAKPAAVNGEPRSDVSTNGDFGSCSRWSRRTARSSSPRIGWVLGVPCLTLRTCRMPVRSGRPVRMPVAHAYRRLGSWWHPGGHTGCAWSQKSSVPQAISFVSQALKRDSAGGGRWCHHAPQRRHRVASADARRL